MDSGLTTVLTTTMTTVRLPDTSTYTTSELVLCLVAPSACAYGSEGWGFESLRARPAQRPFPSLRKCLCVHIDDSFDDLTPSAPATARVTSAWHGALPVVSEYARSAAAKVTNYEFARPPVGDNVACAALLHSTGGYLVGPY